MESQRGSRTVIEFLPCTAQGSCWSSPWRIPDHGKEGLADSEPSLSGHWKFHTPILVILGSRWAGIRLKTPCVYLQC